jgi:hypothetical protein
MINPSKFCLVLVASFLTACGGGGGGSSTPSADPQGFWSGQASTGYTVSTAILENGEAWGIYSSGSTIYGALYGTVAVNGNSISIQGTDFNFLTNTSTAGNLTGTIAAKSSMSLTGNNVSIPVTYQTSYDTPATAAAITGTWSFIGRSGSYSLIPGSITIDSAGRFVLNQTNCVTTGTVVPRSSGKNIYNLTLSASGIGCAAGQTTMSGIVYVDATVTPKKFLSLALTPNKNDGLIVIGTKS